jgi:Spy/CpxP family protein refolding chaperone
VRTLKSLFTPITLSLAFLLAQPFAIAKPPAHNGPIHLRPILKQLDLTDAQRQDVRLLIKQNRATKNTYLPDQKSMRESLRNLIQSDVWAQSDVSSAIQAEQHLQNQLKWLDIKTQQQIWQTLDDAQKEKFLAALNAKKEEKGHGPESQQSNSRGNSKPMMSAAQRQAEHFAALKLTDEQQALFKAQRSAEKADKEANKSAREAFRAQLIAIVTSESLNETSWTALQAETEAQRFEHALNRAKDQHTFWNALTSEQQITLQEMMERRQKRESKKRNSFGRADK